MFIQAYNEATEGEQQSVRESEKDIITQTIDMMRHSDENAADKQSRITALHFTMHVWSYFLNDLISDENQTEDQLKASLISIGIFIVKHLEKMRKEPDVEFRPIREISETILEGMK